jgi:hypothetical protein
LKLWGKEFHINKNVKGFKRKFYLGLSMFAVLFGCKTSKNVNTQNNTQKKNNDKTSNKLKSKNKVENKTTKTKDKNETINIEMVKTGTTLSLMQQKIIKLFRKGPMPNDWSDPGISPNLNKILTDYNIYKTQMMVSCYDRSASPIAARSDDLKKLKKIILDKNVKSGVLDVETANKALVKPVIIKYASKKELREYQQRVRRLIRLLYKNGEIPSSFVKKMEKAAQISIIRFTPEKQLKNDVNYYIRAAIYETNAGTIFKVLENAKIIGKAKNHLGYYTNYSSKKTKVNPKASSLKTDLNSKNPIILTKDKGKKPVKMNSIPKSQKAYRLKVRHAVRALINNRISNYSRFANLEKVLKISILGKLTK